MLRTNLEHVTTDKEFKDLIGGNDNVMVCCGRMGPMCVPVYSAMETMESKYDHVKFTDMDFDTPVANNIRALPEVQGFMGLPFTVYFKKGKVVEATTSIQTPEQIKGILDEHFGG